MRELGAERITAVLGPYACGKCYEVPAEMRAEVAERVPASYAETSWGTPSIDVAAGVSAQLAELDVRGDRRDELHDRVGGPVLLPARGSGQRPAGRSGQAGPVSRTPRRGTGRKLRDNLRTVRERIQTACEAAGRAPEDAVTLVAITKTFPVSDVRALAALGVRTSGENREQELKAKAPECPDVTWHFVGQLQSNKARSVVRNASVVHSVDRSSLVTALSRAAVDEGTDAALPAAGEPGVVRIGGGRDRR